MPPGCPCSLFPVLQRPLQEPVRACVQRPLLEVWGVPRWIQTHPLWRHHRRKVLQERVRTFDGGLPPQRNKLFLQYAGEGGERGVWLLWHGWLVRRWMQPDLTDGGSGGSVQLTRQGLA